MHGFEHDGEADRFGDTRRRIRPRHDAVTAGNNRNAEPTRGPYGVRLVSGLFHALHARADEVQSVPRAQIGESGAFGQEADAWMQGIAPLSLGDANHRVCVEIALIRSGTAETDKGVRRQEVSGGNRFHVGIRLHEHRV